MIFRWWHKLILFLVVASAPSITLLLRGVVWGSDSFAFWAVSCGQNQYAKFLGSPSFFIDFIKSFVGCDLYQLAFIMFLLYLCSLGSVWIIGKRIFGSEGWRLPVYLGALTPLFFLEALRFENDFFGWTTALIALGLFVFYLSTNKAEKWTLLVYAIPLSVLSVVIWTPSVLVLFIAFFFVKLPRKVRLIGLGVVVFAFICLQFNYLLHSFNTPDMWVAEEIPLIGLIFILHILHTYKYIPENFKWYGIFLLVLGALKSKFMFLATPLLLIGLLDKQLKTGLQLKKEVFGVKEIPVLYVCMILLIGFVIMGVNMYPTTKDLVEMKEAIKLSKDNNLPLYNDWGDGWTFISLGFETNYYMSPPKPDWNKFQRPYLAWNQETLSGCVVLKNRLQRCD